MLLNSQWLVHLSVHVASQRQLIMWFKSCSCSRYINNELVIVVIFFRLPSFIKSWGAATVPCHASMH